MGRHGNSYMDTSVNAIPDMCIVLQYVTAVHINNNNTLYTWYTTTVLGVNTAQCIDFIKVACAACTLPMALCSRSKQYVHIR